MKKVGNVNSDYSEADVTDYIESLGVRTISVYVLPRQSFQPDANKQFRVCIFSADKSSLLNAENWSAGITLRDWVFHPKKEDQMTVATVPPPVSPASMQAHMNTDNPQVASLDNIV